MTSLFIDTHTHLYDERFDNDRAAVVEKAIAAGVQKMYLPNCDSTTIAPMMSMAEQWPSHCFPMMGVHPCYIKENYRQELETAASWLEKAAFSAIGEIGLDYYWDTTFVPEQKEAFHIQMNWARQYKLPIVIHTRESLQDGIDMVRAQQDGTLKGIFHCFGGTAEEARQIIDIGFHLGIGGVATFKNGGLTEVLRHIPLEHMVLETDAPYLAPVPYRGKRNESSYIPLIATTIADAKACSVEEVARITTKSAELIFG